MTDYDSWKTDSGEWQTESLEHSQGTAFDLYTESKLAECQTRHEVLNCLELIRLEKGKQNG